MNRSGSSNGAARLPFWFGIGSFMAIAVFFLWTEHRAHLLGALPWLLLLACPLLHLGMHRGHGHHGHGGSGGERADTDEERSP